MKLIFALALFTCAVSAKPNGPVRISFPTGRVVGGKEAIPHSANYIVSLDAGYHFCGGSIIKPNLVITAGHCLQAIACSQIEIIAGLHDLRDKKGSQTRKAIKCIVHEDYGSGVGPYDIGLMILDRPFDFDKNVGAVGLPSNGDIPSGDATLYGWGSISTGVFPQMPNKLQTVTKPIVDYDECESVLGGPGASPLHRNNVCTGPLTGGISACSGDSGGPLVQTNTKGLPVLCGIVSWGYIPCGSKNAPSVYTRTSAYIDWIEKKLAH